MDIAFKIALSMGVVMCGVAIGFGLAVWTLTLPFIIKLTLSSLAICSGIALGSIAIGSMLEE